MTEEEPGREADDLQNFRRNSDQKRSRGAQPAMTSGVRTARRCVVLGAEAWDALRVENAETVERIPRHARSAVPVSAGSANFVVFVGNGPHFTARTRTPWRSEPRSPLSWTLKGRLRP